MRWKQWHLGKLVAIAAVCRAVRWWLLTDDYLLLEQDLLDLFLPFSSLLFCSVPMGLQMAHAMLDNSYAERPTTQQSYSGQATKDYD